MLLPNLSLQKFSDEASNTINKEHLSRRLELWTEGKVNALLSEFVAIQKRLEASNSNNRKAEYISKIFGHFTKTGNCTFHRFWNYMPSGLKDRTSLNELHSIFGSEKIASPCFHEFFFVFKYLVKQARSRNVPQRGLSFTFNVLLKYFNILV